MDNQTLEKYEQLYIKLKEHLEQLKNMNLLIDSIEEEKSSLEDFYYNDWLNISENQNYKNYSILEEDSIYNLLEDLHSEKIILLKKIVANIN